MAKHIVDELLAEDLPLNQPISEWSADFRFHTNVDYNIAERYCIALMSAEYISIFPTMQVFQLPIVVVLFFNFGKRQKKWNKSKVKINYSHKSKNVVIISFGQKLSYIISHDSHKQSKEKMIWRKMKMK